MWHALGVTTRVWRSALLAIGLTIMHGAWAQAPDPESDSTKDPPPEDSPAQMETIVVTGSRIHVKGTETIAPVAVYTDEELRRRGYTTLGDFSRELTLNAGAIDEFIDPFSGGGVTGAAFFNLRGLGTDATLNLLDGRRIVTGGGGGSTEFDLNSVPLSMVDRVEVLKDGASAIYGADAIAGVVNIILRKDYLGTAFELVSRDTLEDDAFEYTATASFGRYLRPKPRCGRRSS